MGWLWLDAAARGGSLEIRNSHAALTSAVLGWAKGNWKAEKGGKNPIWSLEEKPLWGSKQFSASAEQWSCWENEAHRAGEIILGQREEKQRAEAMSSSDRGGKDGLGTAHNPVGQ